MAGKGETEDPVATIAGYLRAVCEGAGEPAPSDRVLRAWASKMYLDMGGSRIYFPKATAKLKTWRLRDATAAGAPFARAYQAVGVSESWAYRLRRRFAD